MKVLFYGVLNFMDNIDGVDVQLILNKMHQVNNGNIKLKVMKYN